jgi:hypothetical protein
VSIVSIAASHYRTSYKGLRRVYKESPGNLDHLLIFNAKLPFLTCSELPEIKAVGKNSKDNLN